MLNAAIAKARLRIVPHAMVPQKVSSQKALVLVSAASFEERAVILLEPRATQPSAEVLE